MKAYDVEAPTEQQILDLTAAHLSGMRGRSMRGVLGCSYLGRGGERCAVGAWLKDEEIQLPYHRVKQLRSRGIGFSTPADTALTIDDLAGSSIWNLLSSGLIPERLIPHMLLLGRLQRAHDQPENWDESGPNFRMAFTMEDIAREHDLDPDSAIRHILRRELQKA